MHSLLHGPSCSSYDIPYEEHDFGNQWLELILQAGGNPHQRCARVAMISGIDAARGAIGVVAIGGNPPSARAQIVMGARSVEGRSRIDIPSQVPQERVLIRQSYHVRLVPMGSVSCTVGGRKRAVVMLSGIAGCLECMRPAKVHTVIVAEFLAHD